MENKILLPGKELDEIISKILKVPNESYSTNFIKSMTLIEKIIRGSQKSFTIQYQNMPNFHLCKVTINDPFYGDKLGESSYIPYSVCLCILNLPSQFFLSQIKEGHKHKALRYLYEEYRDTLTKDEIRKLARHFLNYGQ